MLDTGFKVSWPEGERTYRSARQTIIALVNRAPDPGPGSYDPRWPFDRYFRKGRYKKESEVSFDLFDMFKPDPPDQVVVSVRPSLIIPDERLTVHVPVTKGIDLKNRGHEVRKLFYAGFAAKVIRKGYDPEDVLQEVYKGLLIRNDGRCPWDPKKSSFGHYVHMVCGCIVSNYHRRYNRLSSNEVFGSATFEGEVDVAAADLETENPCQEDNAVYSSAKDSLTIQVTKVAMEEGREVGLVTQCIELLLVGMRYKEMAAQLKRGLNEISDIVRLIKRVAQTWRLEVQF